MPAYIFNGTAAPGFAIGSAANFQSSGKARSDGNNQTLPSAGACPEQQAKSSDTLKLGVGVGIGVGLPLLAAVAVLSFLLLREKKSNRNIQQRYQTEGKYEMPAGGMRHTAHEMPAEGREAREMEGTPQYGEMPSGNTMR